LPSVSSRPPELLDSGAVIARRIIQLAEKDADMGAMFLRQVLWRIHEEVGDGTVTAAVLFQSIYDQGVRYISAGGNAMRLRGFLEEGMRIILAELDRQTIRITGKDRLTQIARTLCHDQPIADLLGEIFDVIGEDGFFEISTGNGRETERDYFEGCYWKSGMVSTELTSDPVHRKVELHDAAILISDLDIQDPRALLAFIQKIVGAKIRTIVLLASGFSDGVIALLGSAARDPAKFQVFAAKIPGKLPYETIAALEDLAVLTGGRPVVKAAGETLESVMPEDLGRARKVWADKTYFGITSGKGNPRAVRRHIARLRLAWQSSDKKDLRKHYRERIGRMMGGSANLTVGGATELEIGFRKTLAERTSNTLRAALRDGALPGGGVALRACCQALEERRKRAADADEMAAFRILIQALKAPQQILLSNSGYEPGSIAARLESAEPCTGFDVVTGKVVCMLEAGILDVAAVQKIAVRSAVSSAALALTTDVLVHHRKPQESMTP
jgi:chaperonin GroEL